MSSASSVSEKGLQDGLVPSSSLDDAANQFPKTQEETEKVEEMLAGEMERLSLDEREKILFDIHGFSENQEESEDRINELLEQMDRVLRKRVDDREAYLLAKSMNKAYVTNRDFWLMFLRSEDYNPRLAAFKVATHFTKKQELFGSGEILGRDVRLSDMSEDAMEALRAGLFQVFPTSDVAGRTVISMAPSHRVGKTFDNIARSYWYIFMTALRGNVEMQKSGFVVVVYTREIGLWGAADELRFIKRLHETRQAIPKKLSALHCCGLDSFARPFAAGLRLFLPRELRTRFRSHYGSYAETIFELQTFGIKAEDHPIDEDGELSLEWHHDWLQMQQYREESDSSADCALVPRRFDVLFGRSRLTRAHTGNLRAAHLVDMYQEEYEQGDKSSKTKMAQRVLGIIHDSGGRFLKWEDEGWVEVDDDIARNKVSHFFRQNRSKKKEMEGPPGSSKRLVADLKTSGGGLGEENAAKRVRE